MKKKVIIIFVILAVALVGYYYILNTNNNTKKNESIINLTSVVLPDPAGPDTSYHGRTLDSGCLYQ